MSRNSPGKLLKLLMRKELLKFFEHLRMAFACSKHSCPVSVYFISIVVNKKIVILHAKTISNAQWKTKFLQWSLISICRFDCCSPLYKRLQQNNINKSIASFLRFVFVLSAHCVILLERVLLMALIFCNLSAV